MIISTSVSILVRLNPNIARMALATTRLTQIFQIIIYYILYAVGKARREALLINIEFDEDYSEVL